MVNPSLAEMQKWMQWIICDSRGVTEALGGCRSSSNCFNAIEASSPLTPEQRLAVYAEGYFFRLRDTLGKDFKLTKGAVGESYFSKIVVDYLEIYPSRYTSVGEVGRRLPEFLASHWVAEEFPFIVDLARFEWEMLSSFYAEDEPSLDLAKLAELQAAGERLRFRLDGSVRLLDLAWPIDAIRRTGKNPPAPEAERLLLYRHEGSVYIDKVDEAAWFLLDGMRRGLSLGELGEQAAETVAIERFGEFFGEWVRLGIIRDVTAD